MRQLVRLGIHQGHAHRVADLDPQHGTGHRVTERPDRLHDARRDRHLTLGDDQLDLVDLALGQVGRRRVARHVLGRVRIGLDLGVRAGLVAGAGVRDLVRIRADDTDRALHPAVGMAGNRAEVAEAFGRHDDLSGT